MVLCPKAQQLDYKGTAHSEAKPLYSELAEYKVSISVSAVSIVIAQLQKLQREGLESEGDD
jgi:hypothetical protein